MFHRTTGREDAVEHTGTSGRKLGYSLLADNLVSRLSNNAHHQNLRNYTQTVGVKTVEGLWLHTENWVNTGEMYQLQRQ